MSDFPDPPVIPDAEESDPLIENIRPSPKKTKKSKPVVEEPKPVSQPYPDEFRNPARTAEQSIMRSSIQKDHSAASGVRPAHSKDRNAAHMMKPEEPGIGW